MKKIMRKGDDFLSIEEAVGDLTIAMNLVTINDKDGDKAKEDFTISVTRIRKRKRKQKNEKT